MGNSTYSGPLRSLNGMYSFGPGTTVNITANTTLDPNLHAGRLLRLNKADVVITLPTINSSADANGTGPGSDPNTSNNQGVIYTFSVETATNANSNIKTDGTDKFFGGVVVANATASLTCFSTTNINIKMNGTTTGGVAGSYLQIQAGGPNKYIVNGILNGTGTIATPFS